MQLFLSDKMFLNRIVDKIEERQNAKREKAKKISIIEGSLNGVQEGCGINYITPYALELGASNTHIGLLQSLPQLFGNLSQLFILKKMLNYTRKQIVFWGVLFQALSWIFIITLGTLYFVLNVKGILTPTLLVLFYTLLISFSFATIPAWASWMKDLMPEKHEGKYFGKRGRIVGFVTLASILIGGFILDFFSKTYIFAGFAIIFGIAGLARLGSAYLFLKKYEPKIKLEKEYFFSLKDFIYKLPKYNFGRIILFYSLMIFAIYLASPFFAVYVLKELNFSYAWYMLFMVANTGANFLSLPFWGKLADKYGNITLIKFSSKLIALTPLFWLLTPLFLDVKIFVLIYIMIIEMFAGFAFAGFLFTTNNFVYDAVSRERMAIVMSYKKIIGSVGIFLGTLLGGIVASFNFKVGIITPILLVFFISFVLRFVIARYFAKDIKEIRKDVTELKFDLDTIETKIFAENRIFKYLFLRPKR